ncbi:MAG TPA: hypothetical protein VEB20_16990 [Azospirillaceae bacterium]|nr:hypothetical protein [Azospirillaceae bacterium]
MERQSGAVEARPPALIGRLLHLLIPPPAREAVMGDLEERYRSPGQFASEGIRAVPYLIASQARRTSSVPVIGLQIFILMACLGGLDPDLGRRVAVPDWAPGAVASAAALLGLVLRNIYRGEEAPVRRGVLDALTAAAFMLASQAMLSGLVSAGLIEPVWLLPRFAYVMGILALPILSILGAAEAGLDARHRLQEAGEGALEAVRRHYARFARGVLMRNRAEMLALGVIIALSSYILWLTKPVVAPFGWSFVAGYILTVAYLSVRGAARPLREEAGLEEACALYGAELARQDRLRRVMWWFWFVPVFAGLITNFIVFGMNRGLPLRAALGAGAVLLLGWFIARVNRDRRRAVEGRVEALSALPGAAA